MKKGIQMMGREIELQVSERAQRALEQRATPLVAEMELYFSCLIRKTVRFSEAKGDEAVVVSDKLALQFRAITTQRCSIDIGNEPPVTDFPITRPERYVPRWMKLDYRGGQWHGDFGYSVSS